MPIKFAIHPVSNLQFSGVKYIFSNIFNYICTLNLILYQTLI